MATLDYVDAGLLSALDCWLLAAGLGSAGLHDDCVGLDGAGAGLCEAWTTQLRKGWPTQDGLDGTGQRNDGLYKAQLHKG